MVIIDEDLGLSGSTTDKRSGFTRLTSEVALAHVGIVLGLEVSRLARNNADWYRLLELCGVTDTLIGDNDGIYHPALFNDRLILGLKGTMSEAELHIIRARLDGGIRNKAARGELRRGLLWASFGENRMARSCSSGRSRHQRHPHGLRAFRRIRLGATRLALVPPRFVFANDARRHAWADPLGRSDLHALHQILTNPVYAGAYTYGKTKYERYVDEHGAVRKHSASAHGSVGRSHPDHHPASSIGLPFRPTRRGSTNTRPEAASVRRRGEKDRHCCRASPLAAIAAGVYTHYRGRNSTPGYHCAGKDIVDGRGVYCLTSAEW